MLSSVEDAAAAVQSAGSMEAAADTLRGSEVTLPSALRWLRRRVRALGAALEVVSRLVPPTPVAALASCPALRGNLAHGHVLLGPRRSLAPQLLQRLPAPLGFIPSRALRSRTTATNTTWGPSQSSMSTTVLPSRSGMHYATQPHRSDASNCCPDEVAVHQHADRIEIFYRDRLVESMPRLRGDRDHRIDYRHVIWSLVRKPGAFARYRYREELFPSVTFRRAYDALRSHRGARADVEYVRVLHLAASTMEADVERTLTALLAEAEPLDYAAVRDRVVPTRAAVPELAIPPRPTSPSMTAS